MTSREDSTPEAPEPFDPVGRIRDYDRDRFVASLFLPADVRHDVHALLAWNLEIARIRETVSEQMVGFIRLQWWREAMEDLFAGTVRQHEVLQSLAPIVASEKLALADFDAILQAREQDFAEAPIETMQGLEAYLQGSSTQLLAMIAKLAGEEADDASLEALGVLWGGLGVLRALPHHGKHGVWLLPTIGPGASRDAVQKSVNTLLERLNQVSHGLDALALPRSLKPYGVLAPRWLRRANKMHDFEGLASIRAGVFDLLALYLQMR
jgi:phytoene/squalene synthetase